MNKPTVLVVFGTRPEVIKLAPVVRELRSRPDLSTRVCVTAQHREMLDQMLRSFDLTPDYDLDLMEPNQDLSSFSAKALPRLQQVLREAKPDFLLIQGDTTTTFVTALAAFYERVPVGHVEAGLRSFDRANPFPEEINRLLTARLSDYHFAPTAVARGNLLAEGIADRAIIQTGNTVIDALRWGCERAHVFDEPALRAAMETVKPGEKIALVTTHRRENLGEPLANLCKAFQSLVKRHDGLHLFYPVHLNPSVQKTVRGILNHPRAHLLPTLDYLDTVHLLNRSWFVMTDSGGLQEEAPSLGKPVLVLRSVTERPEAVSAGVALLAGTEGGRVEELASRLMTDAAFYLSMARGIGLFGDGQASRRIVDAVRHHLGLAAQPPEAFECALPTEHQGRGAVHNQDAINSQVVHGSNGAAQNILAHDPAALAS
ncbi:MAG: UDP-N-acetylglucosamine 2-epimerase (non-hydrolyzing) [Elusimicrobia bacterium]|nr:UDP-N-acetylglucosamine 2-epimerase (non-hydrolyzing) [Elusimicrobiota bacterium]